MPIRPTPWIAITVTLLLLAQAGSARAEEPLIADIDNHLVAITAGFTGTELLVFGSVQGAGDVVIVVHGPKLDVVVRRKDRVAGIWMNRESLTFESVPAFYHIATTAEAGVDLPESALRRHQIGVEHLRMRPSEAVPAERARPFTEALIRNKARLGHYSDQPGVV